MSFHQHRLESTGDLRLGPEARSGHLEQFSAQAGDEIDRRCERHSIGQRWIEAFVDARPWEEDIVHLEHRPTTNVVAVANQRQQGDARILRVRHKLEGPCRVARIEADICLRPIQAIEVVQVCDPGDPLVVVEDKGVHLIGGNHHLISVGLQRLIRSSIRECHVTPGDDNQKLRNKPARTCHRLVKVGQHHLLVRLVLQLFHSLDSQVNARLGHLARNVLVGEEDGHHRGVLLLARVVGHHGKGKRKLVALHAPVEAYIAILVYPNVVVGEAEEGQPEVQRLVMKLFHRVDLRKIIAGIIWIHQLWIRGVCNLVEASTSATVGGRRRGGGKVTSRGSRKGRENGSLWVETVVSGHRGCYDNERE